MSIILSTIVSAVVGLSWGSVGNQVSQFFEKSDMQLEAKSQCKELQRALIDMETEFPSQLSSRRYADYQGQAGKWTIKELLNHYFLSPSNANINEEGLYKDYQHKPAKVAIKKLIKKLNNCEDYATD